MVILNHPSQHLSELPTIRQYLPDHIVVGSVGDEVFYSSHRGIPVFAFKLLDDDSIQTGIAFDQSDLADIVHHAADKGIAGGWEFELFPKA